MDSASGAGASSSSSQQQRKLFGTFMAADHHSTLQQNNQMLSFGTMMQSSSPIPTFNINKDGGAYDLGELDQALFQYLGVQDHLPDHEQRQISGMRPHTLNIFPSQPMHETASKGHGGLVCAAAETSMGLSDHPRNVAGSSAPPKAVKREGNRKGRTSSSEQEPKTPDPKTLRRLAQNREAAKKSRLRKKAYVQQLETCRMRLVQLEDELQRAGSQGFLLGGSALISGDPSLCVGNCMMGNNIANSDGAVFDMEYTRWVEEHNQHTVELRRGVEEQLSEEELRMLVNNQLALYDQLINLKSMMLKSDVFHIFSGVWKTPAERCFLWLGGFRPSDLIKVISRHIEAALTDQQVIGMYGLQQSTQEAEEALSQGIEALNQSIAETMASDLETIQPNMTPRMAHAINKLSTIEAFIRQADNLRRQTLDRLQQILNTRQLARCFLAVAEFFHRLRALSSLWLGRSHRQ